METCMIKNCEEATHEEGLCAKHYNQIIKSAIPKVEQNPKTKTDGDTKETIKKESLVDISSKTMFLMQSLLVHVDKLTDSIISSFNNVFNLTKEEVADIHRQVGGKYINKSKDQKAIPYLKKVVELNPNDADSIYKLGRAFYETGSFDEAILNFQNATKLEPEEFTYHYALGMAYSQMEVNDKAIASLKKASKLNQDDAEIHYRLGVLHDKTEIYQQAVDSFNKAIKLDPTQSDYYQSLGLTYESMDLQKEAVKCYKKVLSLKKSAL